MSVVWKFVLNPSGIPVPMPVGARVLRVAEQGYDICMWALVDPLRPIEERRFVVVGTGHPMPPVGDYLGTAMLEGGALVLHVFEAVP